MRFIRSTHYQVGHPVYLGFLIRSCTSPVQSKTEGKVVDVLHKTLQKHGYQCSKEAAKFLVRMSRHMGLLKLNHIWTWKGSVINHFENLDDMENYYKITRISSLSKKIVYLKYYLESDGALLIHFARRILNDNGVRKYTIRYTNEVVEPIFRAVIEEYLAIETNFPKRIELKNFLKFVSNKGYQSKVRIHKAFSHLDPLVDLGILNFNSKSRKYLPEVSGEKNVTNVFLEQFPNASSLEGIFLFEDGNQVRAARLYGVKSGYYERAAELYDISHDRLSPGEREIVSEGIARIYSEVRDEVTGLASIRAIKDIVCTHLLLDHKILCEWPDVGSALKDLKKKRGVNLRFHVDRRGEVAYIVLS